MTLTLLKAKSNSFVHSIFAFLGKPDRAVKGARIWDLLGHMSLQYVIMPKNDLSSVAFKGAFIFKIASAFLVQGLFLRVSISNLVNQFPWLPIHIFLDW